MLSAIMLWGLAAGVAHFFLMGFLYGNPIVDRIYADAPSKFPSVKGWKSKPKYLLIQFLGTQVEVYALTTVYFLLRSAMPHITTGLLSFIIITISFVRIYPRLWNMWIQSTYPGKLLAIEFVNGAIGSVFVLCFIEKLAL